MTVRAPLAKMWGTVLLRLSLRCPSVGSRFTQTRRTGAPFRSIENGT